jgi:O-methyltransferase
MLRLIKYSLRKVIQLVLLIFNWLLRPWRLRLWLIQNSDFIVNKIEDEGQRPNKYVARLKYPITHNSSGFATVYNCDFISDPKFEEAYDFGVELSCKWNNGKKGSMKQEWHTFTACWAGMNALKLGGDFVECGVSSGILSGTMMHYLCFDKFPERTFFLLDTFSGIPLDMVPEEERETSNVVSQNQIYGNDNLQGVKDKFSRFQNCEIIPGVIPDTLSRVNSDQISYLSIDLNNVEPEIQALQFFWPILTPGAIVILDDYGHPAHIDQKRAMDLFASENEVIIFPLPTRQGLIIKP